jgi:NADH-quinone oxidoreductase subunit L
MLRGASHWLSIAGVAAAAGASVYLFTQVLGAHGHPEHWVAPVYEWFAPGTGKPFSVVFWVDPLTAVMLVTVTVISTLVVIYSREYMRDHGQPVRGYERFFAYLALFVFSMCALVLGGNFLLLYLGWELVGACSYLLIGFYYDKPSAAAAAKKAFLVNRIGDFGFGLGILLIYLTFGQLDYASVLSAAATNSPAELAQVMDISPDQATTMFETMTDRLPIIALLLFCGAVGKSAQLPLYVWLPDAMEGPSPVSALIHAATMVTAGVYMVARCGAIFVASDQVMTLVAVVGGVTAIFAATIALTQHDMKRILAYSTISQLGYMFLGLGCYAASSAVFHLYTHAFFKALLFLGAGSVMHAMGGIIDLRYFSGIRKIMPWTFRFFLIGSLALAGFPLLAGFWSKDEIIHAALIQHPILGWMAMLTALMTAFYTFRMVFRCFFGQERTPEGTHPHEAGGWILAPLGILSIGAVLAGYVGVSINQEMQGFLGVFDPHGQFHHFLEGVMAPFAPYQHHADHAGYWETYGLMYLSGILAIIGIGAAWWMYVSHPWIAPTVAGFSPKLQRLLFHKYYVDEVYDTIIVKPLRKTGSFCYGMDRYVIDGLVWVVTAIPRGLALALRAFQQGALQGYALTMAGGLAIVLLWLMVR